MFGWFKELKPKPPAQSPMSGLRDQVPSPESVHRWDDASLFAECGFRAGEREHRHGFDSLNETERVLLCLYLLDSEVMNGGFGQWLFHCHPCVLGHTVWACQRAGAGRAARLVEEILRGLENPGRFRDRDEWHGYLDGLPDAEHDRFENTAPFLELENELLDSAYRFARAHWAEVRVA